MNTEFLNDMQPNLTERLGRFYCRDVEYKKALKRENELFGRLEKSFSEDQLQMMRDYQNALYATWGVCEIIAYRQGMRDMAALIGIENKGD